MIRTLPILWKFSLAFNSTICENAGMEPFTEKPTSLASLLNISVSYASALLNGERPWTQPLAIGLFRKTGKKIGPIAAASDDEIAVLEKYQPTTTEGRAA